MVMQYLMNASEEFRQTYVQIDRRIDEVLDKLDVLVVRVQELELRVNNNKNPNL